MEEPVRLAYVAATRAEDLLVIPALGDLPFESGWASPLSGAIYPDEYEPTVLHPAVPEFTGRDTVLERPDGQGPGLRTMRPGVFEAISTTCPSGSRR